MWAGTSLTLGLSRKPLYVEMKEPTPYEKVHWAVFNILAKVFAYGLVLICIIFIVLVISDIDTGSSSTDYPAWLLVLFLPLLLLGIFMTKAKPYYPVKYKDWYERGNKQKV